MKKHLNEQEVLERVAGQRDAASDEHVRACPECRNEITRLNDALGGFRTTAREWAETVRREVAVRPPVRHRGFGWQGLRLAGVLAVLLVCLGVLLIRHEGPRAVEMSSTADDAVLERVDAAMSRSVPSAMEPLSQLVPTQRKELALKEKVEGAN